MGSGTGPPTGTIMRGIVASLERAVPGPPNGRALVRDAMSGLLTLNEAMARGDVPDPAALRRFRQRVAELLKTGRNLGQLAAYIGLVVAYAQRGAFDGYQWASEGRSALQILRDDFAEWQLLDDMAWADLEEIDEELADAAGEAPPIPESEIPSWVPASHWWWRAPKRTDMSPEERRYRLYGGELEEY